MKALPLALPDFESGEEFLKMESSVNEFVIKEMWFEVKMSLDAILNSKYSKDQSLMKELIKKINIPRKLWKALETEKSENCLSVMHLMSICSNYADKDTLKKYFVDWGGHLSLQKHFANNLDSEHGQFYCIGILNKFVVRSYDPECARLVLPVAKQFKEMVLEKSVSLRVMDRGVKFIHMIATVCDGSGHLIADIFKSELSSYCLKVFSKCKKLNQSELEVDGVKIVDLLNSLCWTISMVLPQKSVSLNMEDLPILTKKLCDIMKSATGNMKDNYEVNVALLDAVVTSLYEFVERANEQDNLVALKGFGITGATVQILHNVFSAEKPCEHDHQLKYDCYMLLNGMVDVEPDFKTIAPILGRIEKSLVKDPIPVDMASTGRLLIATMCMKAVKDSSADDVKYLVDKGVLPLLARTTVDLIPTNSIFGLAQTLYRVILVVPETDDFSLFEKQHLKAMFHQFRGSNVPAADKLIYGYVIAAIGISSLKAHTDRIKSMNDYFQELFQKIEIGTTSLTLIYPSSFILRKMIKANCFKITILSHTWFLANNGDEDYVKNLYAALPGTDSYTQVLTKKEMKEQVLKHVLEEVKPILDRHTEYSKADLIKLTNFLALIPCQEQCDIVLYQLEDLVSYCLDLIEDQSNKKIVANVKKFIKNLHYS